MKHYYKDFIGCTASTQDVSNGVRLRIRTPQGKLFYNKVLTSLTSCKRVMSRYSDGTMEELKNGL